MSDQTQAPSQTIREAARASGIHEATLRGRIRRGMTLQEALAAGKQGRGNKSGKPRTAPQLHTVFGEQLTLKEISARYGISPTRLIYREVEYDGWLKVPRHKVSIEEYLKYMSEFRFRGRNYINLNRDKQRE